VFGNLKNLSGLLNSAKEFQANLARLQTELASRRYDGDAGGGMVRATVDGQGVLVNIKIDPRAAADVELLEDLVKAALGAALAKSREDARREMASLTGGINLPGLSELLGG
jgi:hypothetical protein